MKRLLCMIFGHKLFNDSLWSGDPRCSRCGKSNEATMKVRLTKKVINFNSDPKRSDD